MAKKLGFVKYNNKFSVNEKVRKVIDSLIEIMTLCSSDFTNTFLELYDLDYDN